MNSPAANIAPHSPAPDAQREFSSAAATPPTDVSRRDFIKLMGASAAMAGLAGCSWPQETILPHNTPPEGHLPGEPIYYASCLELGGVAGGILAKSFDGRPIKVEGNPLCPISKGTSTQFDQAAILGLYDPNRSQRVVVQTGDPAVSTVSSQAAFLADLARHLGSLPRPDTGLYVLTEASTSPTVQRLREELSAKYPAMVWLEYEPVHRDTERLAIRAHFGKSLRPQWSFDKASVIVSLDADWADIGRHPASLKHARDFASTRRPPDHDKAALAGFAMSRHYAAEPIPSTTGSSADFRAPIRPRHLAAVAGALLQRLVKAGLSLGELAAFGTIAELAVDPSLLPEWIDQAADDLLAARKAGRHSIVIAGPRASEEVHRLCLILNTMLGNIGKTLSFIDEPAPAPYSTESIARLARDLESGAVRTLLIVGGNPVFDAPADLALSQRLDELTRTGFTAHLSLYNDETSRHCLWHINRAHALETWSDGRGWDGSILLGQPLIKPLYDGVSSIELLAMLLNLAPARGHDLVRTTARSWTDSLDFERTWQTWLHDGMVPGTASATMAPAPGPATRASETAAAVQASATPARPGEFELVFLPDARVYDGRFANNAWLQELPDPITKLTWDNAALISWADQRAPDASGRLSMRLAPGDEIEIRLDADRSVARFPVWVIPGVAPGVIGLPLGYGRQVRGLEIATGAGRNAYPLRMARAMGYASAASIVRTGKRYKLATTIDHHAQISESLAKAEAEYRIANRLIKTVEMPALVAEAAKPLHKQKLVKDEGDRYALLSLFDSRDYSHQPDGVTEPHKWAMTIDLSTCIGCSACMVACQAENNIPVVGKSEIARGREMHWLRIDRYFTGNPANPTLAYQPIACVHCENAPCEQVCPVAATVHDTNGLNVMIYNRCIGTRYCSNNCPYKVRRFNWFYNWGDSTTGIRQAPLDAVSNPVLKMMNNPEVTVRGRGVMEKCTYCIQRIKRANIERKNAYIRGRAPTSKVPDGTFTTACAQACPTQAITFGDLNGTDGKGTDSLVRPLWNSPRAYAVLSELNIKARTRYLARVQNTGAAPGPAAKELDH